MALDAASPQERVEQLIALTERLTGMMRQEAEAFESHRGHEVLAGQEEVARLANLYRHESLKIRRDPLLVGAAPAPVRKRLISATREFDSVLARHGRAVEAARIVTEGLVKAIAEEITAQRSVGAGYGPGAAGREGSATAVTLNRRA